MQRTIVRFFIIYTGIILLPVTQANAQDSMINNFEDIIHLDTIFTIKSIDIQNDLNQEIVYSKYNNYIFFSDYSSVIRISDNPNMILYKLDILNGSLDSFIIKIPVKVVKKNSRVMALYADNNYLLLSFNNILIKYRKNQETYLFDNKVRMRPSPMYINKIDNNFLVYHHYKFRGPYLFLKNMYIQILDTQRLKKKYEIQPYFNHPEYTYLNPHKWIDNNEDNIFFSQTTTYEINKFDKNLKSNLLFTPKDWKILSVENYEDIQKMRVRNQINYLRYFDNFINRVIYITCSDSLLLVEYYNPGKTDKVIGYFDLWKIEKDTLINVMSNLTDQLNGSWDSLVLTKENIPFYSPSYPNYLLMGNKLIQFRDEPIVNPIGNTSCQFYNKVENAVLTNKPTKLRIYIFAINL